jgi:glucose-1-phosphate thymidylyltransferase
LNRLYLEKDQLYVEDLKRGFAWLDTGTHDSLIEASEFVRVVQKRQGIQVACLEEIAYRNHFISRDKLIERGNAYVKTSYGRYLLQLAEQDITH